MAKKIIIIDDSKTARMQVRSALLEGCFDIVEAVDGLDGLSKVIENEDASVVLCDVNMPNMTGLEMLSALKEKNKGAGMSFLMLTTEAEAGLIRKARDVGAKGWIVKPFKAPLLLATVMRLAGA